MKEVKVLIPTGYGLNCDYETAHAFRLAGAVADRVHINSIIDGSVLLDHYRLLVFIGGFSWGDDHGAGVIEAIRFKSKLGDRLVRFAQDGNLILGVCNGFQTLVNMGLLPGFGGDYHTRSAALIHNDCGNFRDQWVTLKIEPSSVCVFTRGMDRLELPVRHGEGKFYAESPVIARLFEKDQVPLRYARPDGEPAEGAFPFNPNGSLKDIAGICDASGRIFGLMPHPEAYNHLTSHPDWTRLKEERKRRGEPLDDGTLTPGIQMLKNGVDFVRNRL
ncbi:MAG: phosphoribosylformylglycinamidine synthase subunit PurQ [Desulfobacteraceae bacterium]|nr:MAG: phosphoribosylformylglycinamidine synthase subunit PurQ [Desulfobacteraceae bacterium]